MATAVRLRGHGPDVLVEPGVGREQTFRLPAGKATGTRTGARSGSPPFRAFDAWIGTSIIGRLAP